MVSITRNTPALLAVPEADLDDLRRRLRTTRWAASWPLPGWQAGTDGETLRRLVALWADGFDWRAQEAALNALPHRFAEIDGISVHYLLFESAQEGARPLLLANGWPSTFFELTDFAQRLTGEGFTVVVPSLPGFTFSAPRPALDTATPTHELWHRLMRDELGFDRYGAHGSDLGSAHVGWLAQAHPESVIGIHLLDVDKRVPESADLTDEEREFLAGLADWEKNEGAYGHQHRTRPLTLAQGLSDSPAGLLAWIVEKYHAWTGDFSLLSDEFLLTQASLYWFTNTISTSFRDYYERGNGFAPRLTRVEVPTAVAWFPADLGAQWPRSWVERKYRLERYTVMPRGGHFAAREEPELLADDVTAFFRSLAW